MTNFLLKKTFIFSLFCHLLGFILIGFSLPKIPNNDFEINFLGSFLTKIDFLKSRSLGYDIKDNRVLSLDKLFINKINISLDKAFLISDIDRPRLAGGLLSKNIFFPDSKKNDIMINKAQAKSSLVGIEANRNILLPLKSSIPSNFMKIKLMVAKNGRVEFVERLESSGNLESDLLAKRIFLDYLFYPSFNKESQVKKINLFELANVQD